MFWTGHRTVLFVLIIIISGILSSFNVICDLRQNVEKTKKPTDNETPSFGSLSDVHGISLQGFRASSVRVPIICPLPQRVQDGICKSESDQ